MVAANNEKIDEKLKEDELIRDEATQNDTAQDEAVHENDDSLQDKMDQEQESLHQLEMTLAEERAKAEEFQQRLLRTQADYDNFRKRTQKEKEEMAKYAATSLLEKLLPVVDNLERALDSSKQTQNFEAFVQGVEMVYRQLIDALQEEGAVAIDAVGKPFDPYFHQAVMQEESNEHESGIVLEEFQKGYMLKDKVIRHSMVKVTT